MEDGTDLELLKRITVRPELLGGKPAVTGTRLGVKFLLDLMAGGWSEEVLLEEYPGLTKEDLQACLAYAGLAVEHFRMIPATA